jgi:outer membrane protein
MHYGVGKQVAIGAVAGLLALVNGIALADGPGPRAAGAILLRGGTHIVMPESPGATIGTGPNTADLDVQTAAGFTFNVTYFVTPHVAVELLAAAPFSHDIELAGQKVASTSHLPPTLSVQYHFAPASRFQPYLGAGLNYTWFFNEQTTGVLAGTDLRLRNSLGYAVQGGLDYRFNDHLFVNGDVRYMSIETRARLNGVGLTGVKINPVAIGLTVGWQF